MNSQASIELKLCDVKEYPVKSLVFEHLPTVHLDEDLGLRSKAITQHSTLASTHIAKMF